MDEELEKALKAWVDEKDRVARQGAFDTLHFAAGSAVAQGVSAATRARLHRTEKRLYELATRYIF